MNAEELYATYFAGRAVAPVVISIALMLMMGFLMTRITKRLHLPNVTAYIVAGILLGPFVLDIIPAGIVSATSFLPDIALAFIAFGTGEFFRMETLRKNGSAVVIITLFEAILASALMLILCLNILHLPFLFSVILAALAAMTAPTATMMTIRQVHAKGEFVDVLLEVVAMDDIVGLVAYSIAVSMAAALQMGQKITFGSMMKPFLVNMAALGLGAVFGLLTMLFMKTRHSTDNRLIIAITMLLTFCGICSLMNVSPLLGCMAMGTVYMNTTEDSRLFAQLNYFSPPILMLFFVRSGLSFNLQTLFGGGEVNGTPLVAIGLGYIVVRFVGKYVGALLGCRAVRKEKKIGNYLGLGLIPQASVAIGLAELGARTLGGELGQNLLTMILATSIVYELIGPALTNWALYKVGSYSRDLEAAAPVATVTEEGNAKPQVELLIERIRKIQEEMAREKNPYEDVFTDAAEDYLLLGEDAEMPRRKKRKKKKE